MRRTRAAFRRSGAPGWQRKWQLAAAVVLVVLLAAPSSSIAGWRVQRASMVARIVWHNPCVDRMQIHWAGIPAGATEASAWTWVDDCVIWFDQARPLAWEPFCTLVLHEAGHLAGLGHTARGIMSPVAVFERETSTVNGRRFTRWLGTDRRCRARGRPFLKAHGF